MGKEGVLVHRSMLTRMEAQPPQGKVQYTPRALFRWPDSKRSVAPNHEEWEGAIGGLKWVD